MITETTFARDYRQGLTLEEVSLLQSLNVNSRETAIQELKEQLPYVDQDLRGICQSLYKKLKNMTADAFAEIDFFGEEEAYERDYVR